MFRKFTQSELDQESPPVLAPERVLCGRCDGPITDTAQIITVGGRRTHRRRNPADIEFHFQCFARAPGCRREGAYTTEHSWFPGNAWCYLLCGRCRVHLGWHFRGGDDFCALIIERLRYEHGQ